MDKDAKILTEQYQKITEALGARTAAKMYNAVVDAYYEVDRLGRQDPDYMDYADKVKLGLRNVLITMKGKS